MHVKFLEFLNSLIVFTIILNSRVNQIVGIIDNLIGLLIIHGFGSYYEFLSITIFILDFFVTGSIILVICDSFKFYNKVLDGPDIRIMSFFMIINYYARCYSIIHNSLLSSSQVYINRRY